MDVILDNGKITTLGKNEALEDKYKCPKCGSQLIINYGDGISCEFCTNCDYNEYDYY